MVRIKVCGITNFGDAVFAADSGADALGFIFWEKSPRYIEPQKAAEIIAGLPPFLTCVGVFVDEDAEKVNAVIRVAALDAVQLHGNEPPGYCRQMSVRVIKALRIRDIKDIEQMAGYEVSAFLLDAYKKGLPGGTGETFDWDTAVAAKEFGRIILSGGLTPDNVGDAVARVRPYGVDVSSGIEESPGKKDHAKVSAFIKEARGLC
ncbi:MAG: phosphoribosylanthranilate isomerase [Thermodesulfobacteriota bacterium]|nr:MAG: phosphoribosylanthranilate isomerase [Thermodesulfobacteriota bacterium]